MFFLLCALLHYLKTTSSQGIHFVDSSALPVRSNKRISRDHVFRGFAAIEKTAMGWFYGRKVHDLFQRLWDNGLRVVTGLRTHMKNRLMALFDKILLHKKSIIETILGKLKQTFQAQHTRHRSPVNEFASMCTALIAYIFPPNKSQIRFELENKCSYSRNPKPNSDTLLPVSRASRANARIEGLPRFQDAIDDVQQFSHDGP